MANNQETKPTIHALNLKEVDGSSQTVNEAKSRVALLAVVATK